jgi:hypothetical protein
MYNFPTTQLIRDQIFNDDLSDYSSHLFFEQGYLVVLILAGVSCTIKIS